MIKTDKVLTVELVQGKDFSPAELKELILSSVERDLCWTDEEKPSSILRQTPKFALGDFVKAPSIRHGGAEVYGIIDKITVSFNNFDYQIVYIDSHYEVNRQTYVEKKLELI